MQTLNYLQTCLIFFKVLLILIICIYLSTIINFFTGLEILIVKGLLLPIVVVFLRFRLDESSDAIYVLLIIHCL